MLKDKANRANVDLDKVAKVALEDPAEARAETEATSP